MKCENCSRILTEYDVVTIMRDAVKYGLTFCEITKLCVACTNDRDAVSLHGHGEDLVSYEGWSYEEDR